MTVAQQLAAAKAKIIYWSARTGGTARRWLKYWSNKLAILMSSSSSGVPPGTGGGGSEPAADLLAPAAPVGISASGNGAGVITVVCDPTGDLANGDAVTPSGIASYTLNVDGVDQTPLTVGSLGASANVQSAESYVDIGTITGGTPAQNGRQITATNNGTGIDGTSDDIRVFRPVQETGSFKRRVKLTSFYGSASASVYSYFGLIVRDTASAGLAASPGAKYFAIYQWLTQASQGLETAIRATTSAAKTYRNQVAGGSNARWVEISGSYSGGTWTFIASYSTDGGEWAVLDTYSIGTWGSTVTVGRFLGNEGSEGSDYALTGVFDDDVHLSGSQAAISTTYASVTNVALKWKATDVAGNVSAYSKTVYAAGEAIQPGSIVGVSDQTLRDMGYYLANDQSGVDPTGTLDCTGALQAAIDYAYSVGKPLWLHADAVYLVSDTLRVLNVAPDYYSSFPVHELHGSYNGARPKIKLVSGSLSNFDNASVARPVIYFNLYDSDSPYAVNWNSTNPYSIPSGYFAAPGNYFRSGISNIDIDTNGHAGAVGITFSACQKCYMDNIRIVATGSIAGVWGAPCAGSPSANIEVEGGRYGMLADAPNGVGNLLTGSGPTFIGLKCYNQTVACYKTNDYVANVVVGFDFRPAAGGKACIVTDNFSGGNHPCLIDGTVVYQDSGYVLDNSVGNTAYMRNVYVTGTNNITKFASNSAVTAAGTWKLVNEYCSMTAGGTRPYTSGYGSPDVWSLINGVLDHSTSEPIINVTSSSSAPPSDLLTKHLPDPLTVEHGEYVDVRDYGVTLYGNSPFQFDRPHTPTLADARAGIQAAIDAASAAGHGRVLLPLGVVAIGGTVHLASNTKLFGISVKHCVVVPHQSWVPSGSMVFMFDTPDDANATTSIAMFSANVRRAVGTYSGSYLTGYSQSRFGHFHWRAGRKSQEWMVDTNLEYVYKYEDGQDVSSKVQDKPRHCWHFTGNGGGRHYGSYSDGRGNTGPDWRHIYAEGTTQPLAFYAINMEAGKAGYDIELLGLEPLTNAEFVNCSNIRMYELKREGNSHSAILNNVHNFALYGMGNLITSINYISVDSASNGILVTVCDNFELYNGGQYIVYDEQYNKTVYTGDCMSVYKKGTTDDSLMVFT